MLTSHPAWSFGVGGAAGDAFGVGEQDAGRRPPIASAGAVGSPNTGIPIRMTRFMMADVFSIFRHAAGRP
jgi:hypothetical protein